MGAGYVKVEVGIYNYYKTPTAKPDKCNYWTRCLPTLLLHSTKHLLEQIGKRAATSTARKTHPLTLYKVGTKLGWELIIGADHGKGAWRSIVKVYHTDYPTQRAQEEARKFSWTDNQMEDERGYFLLRHGHIDCRKDDEKIIWNTIMSKLREDFTKLLSSRMVALEYNYTFELFLISKHSEKIGVVSKHNKSYLLYTISDNNQKLATMMEEETILLSGANICLDIPELIIYI